MDEPGGAVEKPQMTNLTTRIKKRVKITCSDFQNDCHFSFYLAVIRFLESYAGLAHLKKLASFFRRKKDLWILNYLSKALKNTIQSYKDLSFDGTYVENAPIWVCWWTGAESAPPLVKQCIKSIKNNAGNHPVHFISQDTYQKYISIPDYIMQKLKNGKMCVANFSDYLRFSLLQQYGGLWLDATIFVSQNLPESYFSCPLFTCKSNITDSSYISQYRWTAFCFGGWQGNLVFAFIKSALEEYWKVHEVSIDYLLIDYVIDLAYNTVAYIRESLNSVPFNNLHRDDLQAAMNAALKWDSFSDIIRPDTILYKLSWREQYSLTTSGGEKSIYAGFLDLAL